MITGIVVVYLLLTLVAGFFINKYMIKSSEDYWVAGRRLGLLANTGTVLATFISGATMVGYISTYYTKAGFASMYTGLGLTVGFVSVMVFMAHKVRRTQFVTIGDLFADRYGHENRMPISVLILYIQVGYLILQNIGLGTALSIVLGWDIKFAIVFASIFTILYVFLGGMFAVVWTDVIQGTIIFVSTVLLVPYFLKTIGGWQAFSTSLKDTASFFYHPTAEGMFGLSYAVRSVLMFGLGNIGFPSYFVRLYTAKDELTARNSYILAGCMLGLFGITTRIIAGQIKVLMPNVAPELVQGVWPLAVKTLLNPVVAGILLTAIVAAIMSTADSVLQVVGTVIARDFYQQKKKDATEKELIKVSRIAILITGVLALIIALLEPASIWDITFYIWTFVANGLAIPLICAFYWKRANLVGSMASSIGGVGVSLVWHLLGSPFGIDHLYPGLVAAILGMVIGSLITPPSKEQITGKYFGPHMSFRNLPKTNEPFGGYGKTNS